MTTGIFEITIDLYTVSSSFVETKTFYTSFLDIGYFHNIQDQNKPNFPIRKAPIYLEPSTLTKP